MSNPKSIQEQAAPRLSASLILLNANHDVLMIQRVQDSRTFAGMHAFPGGNYDASQDGPSTDPRMTAIRETFEETGLLLAQPICYCTPPPTPSQLTLARKAIHSRTDATTFPAFLARHNLSAMPALERLIPFTQWVTPVTAKARFWTWFYVGFLDEAGDVLGAEDVKIESSNTCAGGNGEGEGMGMSSVLERVASTSTSTSTSTPVPTHDNHIEIQSACFQPPRAILQAFDRGDITLMPPQYYLLSMLADILDHHHHHQVEERRRRGGREGEDRSAAGYLRDVVGRGFGERVFNPRFGGKFIGEDGVERSVLMYEGDEEYGKGLSDDGDAKEGGRRTKRRAKHRSLLTFVDGRAVRNSERLLWETIKWHFKGLMSKEMDNEIETEAPPPVSSLRSRWEAMSKKSDAPEESKGAKPSLFGSNGPRSHKADNRPPTPTVIVSSASSSSTPNTPNFPLRRVVSNPTSQPVSPDAAQSSFSSLQSARRSPSNSRESRITDDGSNVGGGAEEDGDETPNSATPRRSPSTPSFGFGNKGFGGIGLGAPPGVGIGGKKSWSVSSAAGVTSTGMNGATPQVDTAITDAEELSRKLSRKPPPPPPGKKPSPPTLPPRSPEETHSVSSSRSVTPSADSDDTRRVPYNAQAHLRSDSSSANLSLNLAPPLPSRGTPSPTFPPRPSALRSPALPPRSLDSPSTTNTLVYHHQGRGFHTPSTGHLSPAGSDGSEHSKPNLIPPKLPFRSGTGHNSAPISPAVSNGPPLPRRNHQVTASLSDQLSPAPPKLPPRSAAGSAAETEDQDVDNTTNGVEPAIGRGSRRVPPPPTPSLRLGPTSSSSPSGSRESLAAPEEDALQSSLQPPPRTSSGDAFLPPPSRIAPPMNDGHPTLHSHGQHQHHHHFPHLPHQLNSLPITKMLAAVKLGGHNSSGGSKSPNSHTSPTPDFPSSNTVELSGTAGLPPPPVRNIQRPNSSMGRHDQDDGTSSDEDDEGNSGSANANAIGGGGGGGGGGLKRPIVKVAEELPDSSRSSRRPPILPEFQHPPAVYAAHHHFVHIAEGVKGTEIRVPSHSGVVAVAGWWVVVASAGVITVTNMNVADRERGGGGGGMMERNREKEIEMELAMGISPNSQSAAGAKGVWTIEMKEMRIDWKVDKPRVTAMEFRHGSPKSLNRSSANLSRSSRNSSRTAVDASLGSEREASDEARYVWCGTRDGCLFELDAWNGGRLNDLRVGAHSGHVTGIFRLPGHRMVTIDEHGKCLVFCGVGMARGSEENLSTTSLGDRSGGWLSRTSPRVHRIQHREGFMRVLNGSLWTSPAALTSNAMSANGSLAAGSGDSITSVLGSGGSLASIAQAATKQHRHHEHRQYRHHRNDSQAGAGPLVRIHDIDDDGALVTRTITSGQNVGAVTCGAVLPSTPGIVYLGHEGGHVTVWGVGEEARVKHLDTTDRLPWQRHHSQASLNSATSTSSCSDEDESHTEEESPMTAGRGDKAGSPGGPVCLRKVKISISDVISLEGVSSRLWAGTRKGLIYAYDVTGNAKTGMKRAESKVGETDPGQAEVKPIPWVVTNVWKAHGELPVARIVVDPFSVAKTQKLVAYSVGRDEVLRFWDGFLSQDWIDSEMITRETSFCTFRPLKMLMCTWNIDAAKPDSLIGTNNVTFLQRFLASPALEGSRPDMIVFGFQEVIDLEDKKLTAKTVLLGTGKKRADGTISGKVSRHYRLWHDKLVAEVQRGYPSESYIVQHTENLVGLFTCVFVRRELAKPAATSVPAVRDIAITTVKCGMHGMYGNKGAIVARFTIDDTSLCFLNCHLAAGQSQKVARNMDLASILEEKSVFPVSVSEDGSIPQDFVAYVGGGDGSMVLDHELCFLSGDLNYRIEQRRDTVISNIQTGKLSHLLQYDQLRYEMRTNPTFRLHTFTEPPITFAPTYKYDRSSNMYDSSEKRRIPAWCDRILYRSRDPGRIENLWYGRYEPDVSDHRPVCGAYRVVVKKLVPEKRAKEFAAVRRLWERELVRLCAEVSAFYEG